MSNKYHHITEVRCSRTGILLGTSNAFPAGEPKSPILPLAIPTEAPANVTECEHRLRASAYRNSIARWEPMQFNDVARWWALHVAAEDAQFVPGFQWARCEPRCSRCGAVLRPEPKP